MADQADATISIDAAPGEVMDVIADVTAYPHWDTGIAHADILDPGAGRPTQVRVKVEAGPITDVQVRDYQWHGNHRVSWTLHSSGSRTLRSAHGTYVLTPTPDGGTQVTLTLSMNLNAPIVGALTRRAEKVITHRTLTALKHRVDHLHLRPPTLGTTTPHGQGTLAHPAVRATVIVAADANRSGPNRRTPTV